MPNDDRMGLVDVERSPDAEVEERRRRHWLGVICAGLLLAIGVGVWWHVEDPFNPYRDGTTHAATLVQNPYCPATWGTSLDHERYVYQTLGGVPDSFGNGPVTGQVHIVRQRSSNPSSMSAVFTGEGATISLTGGREPVFFYATCAIR